MNNLKKILIVSLLASQVLLLFACRKDNSYNTEPILNQTILDRIYSLETENNIIINYYDAPLNAQIDDKYILSSNVEEIEAAVEAAEIIFSRFPENWAVTISNSEVIIDESKKIEKVHIVFCESIEADEDKYGSEYLVKGNYYTDDNEIYYLIDIHNYEPKVAISETLIYRIVRKKAVDDDLEIEVMGDDGYRDIRIENSIIRRYTSYNPEGFDYYGYISEIRDEDKQYVYGSADDLNSVYFVNAEALYSEYIDLVQTVSPLLYTDKEEGLPEVYQSEYIKSKAISAISSINDAFFFRGVEYLSSWFE